MFGSLPVSGKIYLQLSVTGERMNTKYWLTVYHINFSKKSLVRKLLSDRPDLT